jgi:hypothetical protein
MTRFVRTLRPHMIPRLATFAAAVAVVAGAGCQYNPAAAQFPSAVDTITVYALNGTPPSSPAGIDLKTGSAVRLDQTFVFDIALDIPPTGGVAVLPVRVVANGLESVRSVGLQQVNAGYDTYTEAFTSGYHYDSTLVVPIGTTVAINPIDATTCTVYSIGTSYYAKLIVDSVNATTRALYVRLVSDPNCGYRTLAPGVPSK